MAIGCYNPDDNYLPASFKGVPFEALEVTSQHGRRGAQGEFPWGENTAYVDLGRSIRTYSISGRFSDNNHIAMANALAAAVETPGAGILIHPTRGVITAACKSLKIKDNPIDSAGVTTFDAEFVEANVIGNGLQFLNTLASTFIGVILSSVSNSFKRKYKPEKARWYNSDKIVSTMFNAVSYIRNEYEQATISFPERWTVLSSFDTTLNDPYILNDADKASKVVLNGLSYIDTDADNSFSKENAFKNIANGMSQSPTLESESGDMENAIFSYIRITAAAYLAKSYLAQSPENLSEALSDLDKFSSIINEEIEIAREDCEDPSLYRDLLQFRSDAQKALFDRAYKSPALVEYHFASNTHSLMAAYEIFGDAKRFHEIEARNVGIPWNIGPNIIAPRG